MQVRPLPLDRLDSHPGNSNVMPPRLFEKLLTHLRDSDRYPAVIVRPRGDRFQILDGHHRVAALRHLGRTTVRCEVWEANDAQALTLLATLNRLRGRDDPLKRAALLEDLGRCLELAGADLAARLPEEAADLERLLRLRQPPVPQPPRDLADLPVAVHFFLSPDDRRRLEQRLRALGGGREQALMRLVAAES